MPLQIGCVLDLRQSKHFLRSMASFTNLSELFSFKKPWSRSNLRKVIEKLIRNLEHFFEKQSPRAITRHSPPRAVPLNAGDFLYNGRRFAAPHVDGKQDENTTGWLLTAGRLSIRRIGWFAVCFNTFNFSHFRHQTKNSIVHISIASLADRKKCFSCSLSRFDCTFSTLINTRP